MEVPAYITSSYVVLLHAMFLFNKESCKFIDIYFTETIPKNIQYLHAYLYVHYIQLPCKVILNFVFSSKCQQSKAAQHVVHSRCDSTGSDTPPVMQICLNMNSAALTI
jgi:hypothetical protein